MVEARKAYDNHPNNAKKKSKNKINVDGIESLKSQPQTMYQKKSPKGIKSSGDKVKQSDQSHHDKAIYTFLVYATIRGCIV